MTYTSQDSIHKQSIINNRCFVVEISASKIQAADQEYIIALTVLMSSFYGTKHYFKLEFKCFLTRLIYLSSKAEA